MNKFACYLHGKNLFFPDLLIEKKRSGRAETLIYSLDHPKQNVGTITNQNISIIYIYIFIYLYIYLSIYLSIYLLSLSFFLFLCLSFSLYIYIYIYIYIFFEDVILLMWNHFPKLLKTHF